MFGMLNLHGDRTQLKAILFDIKIAFPLSVLGFCCSLSARDVLTGLQTLVKTCPRGQVTSSSAQCLRYSFGVILYFHRNWRLKLARLVKPQSNAISAIVLSVSLKSLHA